jgi:hypothetical protein
MIKPKPIPLNHKFASESEEMEHMLDVLCWMTAEDMALDTGIPPEEGAETIKQYVQEGRLVVDFDAERDRVRLCPPKDQLE